MFKQYPDWYYFSNELAPRDAASSVRVLTHLDLFAVSTLTLASLSLMQSQIKNASVCVIITFRMTEKREQVCIKFCKKLGKTCTETYNIIKMAFTEDSTSHTQVFEWFCHFKEG